MRGYQYSTRVCPDLCKVSIIGMQVTSASAAIGKPIHLETSETKHLVGSGSKRGA